MVDQKYIDKQLETINELQKEIIDLRTSNVDEYYQKIINNLQDELLLMHKQYDQVCLEKRELQNQCDELKKSANEINLKYSTIVNSRSWKKTQIIRDIYWKFHTSHNI